MSADWYARKLAALRGDPAPASQPSYPPAGHPGYAPPPGPQYAPGPTTQANPVLTSHADVRAFAGAWKGGEGTKTETTKCPQCGGTDYFSRRNAPGVMNSNTGQTVKPNPICMDCGYAGREDWTQVAINLGG